MKTKKKTIAGLLGIFLGAYGGHHFYLDNTQRGLLHLLFSLFTGIGFIVFGIVGFVEGIKILKMSDDAFEEYCKGISEKNNPGSTLTDEYEVLLQYKELLDMQAITDTEYNYLKNRIMGE